LTGPTIDTSQLVGPTIDFSKFTGPTIDTSKLVELTIDLDRFVGATLRESNFFDGVVTAAGVGTTWAISDIDIPELAGGMSVGELLGSRIDVSALVGSDVAVTDLLGDRLEAEALSGDPIEPDSLSETRLDSLTPEAHALANAVVSRVDELEAELVGRLDHIQSTQALRRQLVLMVLAAIVALLLTVAIAQVAPQLIDPGAGQNVVTQPVSSDASNMPRSPRPHKHGGPDGARSQQIEHINMYVQDRLRARGLAEVRAVEAARWLDEASVLSDSPPRPGLPLRKLLRAGVITGAEQRPDRPHGRWFIVRT
jgi:hypothetical protein